MTKDEINVSLFDEAKKLQIENARLREHLEKLTRLLRESAKSDRWPSPTEIDSALNRSADILSNVRDHRPLPAGAAGASKEEKQ
jgi:regulator of replication initiation timing